MRVLQLANLASLSEMVKNFQMAAMFVYHLLHRREVGSRVEGWTLLHTQQFVICSGRQISANDDHTLFHKNWPIDRSTSTWKTFFLNLRLVLKEYLRPPVDS